MAAATAKYGGNRSRQLDSNYDDEVKMIKNAKRIISQAGEGLALTKDAKKSNYKDPVRYYEDNIIGYVTNNVAHEECCPQTQMMLLGSISEHIQSNPNRRFWKPSRYIPTNTRF